jgi:transposase
MLVPEIALCGMGQTCLRPRRKGRMSHRHSPDTVTATATNSMVALHCSGGAQVLFCHSQHSCPWPQGLQAPSLAYAEAAEHSIQDLLPNLITAHFP